MLARSLALFAALCAWIGCATLAVNYIETSVHSAIVSNVAMFFILSPGGLLLGLTVNTICDTFGILRERDPKTELQEIFS